MFLNEDKRLQINESCSIFQKKNEQNKRKLPDSSLQLRGETCTTKLQRRVTFCIQNINSSDSISTQHEEIEELHLNEPDFTNDTFKNNGDGDFLSDDQLIPYIILGSTLGIILASVFIWVSALGVHVIIKKVFQKPEAERIPFSTSKIVDDIVDHLNLIWYRVCRVLALMLKEFVETYAT